MLALQNMARAQLTTMRERLTPRRVPRALKPASPNTGCRYQGVTIRRSTDGQRSMPAELFSRAYSHCY